MLITRQQRVFYKTFSQHGSGAAMAEVEPRDIVLLIHIAYLDIFENEPDWFSKPFSKLAKESFYTITPEKVAELPDATVEEAINYLQLSGATNTENVIYLYLKNLSELWRRRFKFYNILKTHPFPLTEQSFQELPRSQKPNFPSQKMRMMYEGGLCPDLPHQKK